MVLAGMKPSMSLNTSAKSGLNTPSLSICVSLDVGTYEQTDYTRLFLVYVYITS